VICRRQKASEVEDAVDEGVVKVVEKLPYGASSFHNEWLHLPKSPTSLPAFASIVIVSE